MADWGTAHRYTVSGAAAEDGFSVSGMKMAVSTILASFREVVTLRREALSRTSRASWPAARPGQLRRVGVLTSAPLSLPSNSESKTYKQAVLVNSR